MIYERTTWELKEEIRDRHPHLQFETVPMTWVGREGQEGQQGARSRDWQLGFQHV
jgi:hypothetical protein